VPPPASLPSGTRKRLALEATGRNLSPADVQHEIRGPANDRAERELGWQLRYPSWRQGFVEGLG
jgi:hypothetical protein